MTGSTGCCRDQENRSAFQKFNINYWIFMFTWGEWVIRAFLQGCVWIFVFQEQYKSVLFICHLCEMIINITSIINKAWETERREEAEQLPPYKFLSLHYIDLSCTNSPPNPPLLFRSLWQIWALITFIHHWLIYLSHQVISSYKH